MVHVNIITNIRTCNTLPVSCYVEGITSPPLSSSGSSFTLPAFVLSQENFTVRTVMLCHSELAHTERYQGTGNTPGNVIFQSTISNFTGLKITVAAAQTVFVFIFNVCSGQNRIPGISTKQFDCLVMCHASPRLAWPSLSPVRTARPTDDDVIPVI